MTPEPDVPAILKRLHEMVDNFEPTLQFSLDNGMFATARVTFAKASTGESAYVLVGGFEEPDDDVLVPDDFPDDFPDDAEVPA